nr:PREDICTED: platelet glycoprotein VI-like [Opisthocomus hoazin]
MLPVTHVLAFGAWLVAQSKATPTLETRGGRAEFSISNATQEDSGAYSCHYLDGDTVLARSETLEVTVHEFRLPRPVLSILPGRDVAAGASVTFRCAIAHSSATCFLYREGQVEAQQTSNEDREVSFPRVTKGDGGCYSCQCFTWNASFQWSAVSEAQDLVVRGAQSLPQREEWRRGGRERRTAGPFCKMFPYELHDLREGAAPFQTTPGEVPAPVTESHS